MNLEMLFQINVFVDLETYGVLEQIELGFSDGNFGTFFAICINPR